MEFLIAAISLGFLGSFHCIGMCGPIAMALPLGRETKFKRVVGGVVYNLGRVFTYGVFGLLFGLLGKGFVIGGYQQILSISLGVFILLGLLLPSRATSFLGLTKVILPIVTKVKSLLGNLFKQKSYSSLFSIGVLNGLLPCGLVYTALAVAATSGDVFRSTLTMLAFGLGTMPAVMSIGVMTSLMVKVSSHGSFRQIAGCTLIFLALMGMAPNINPLVQHPMPHVSP